MATGFDLEETPEPPMTAEVSMGKAGTAEGALNRAALAAFTGMASYFRDLPREAQIRVLLALGELAGIRSELRERLE